MRKLLSLVVVIVLATGCAGRDKSDSADAPPVDPPTTGAGASDSAATTSASDTSTTTRPAESVHTDTQQ